MDNFNQNKWLMLWTENGRNGGANINKLHFIEQIIQIIILFNIFHSKIKNYQGKEEEQEKKVILRTFVQSSPVKIQLRK